MLERHDHVAAQGGTCIMTSLNSIGLPAMKVLRAHSQLCIHGHRNGWGIYGGGSLRDRYELHRVPESFGGWPALTIPTSTG